MTKYQCNECETQFIVNTTKGTMSCPLCKEEAEAIAGLTKEQTFQFDAEYGCFYPRPIN
ncbi:hypothetical protein BTS2_0493 [Bacillus sp. TS-2]|nr:hypothetical protein BTS2_0493 [Bacillus sp. TS-2]